MKKIILLLVIIIIAGIVAKFTILNPDFESPIKNLDDIKRIQHGLAARGICARYGDAADFPENTIPAFNSAIKQGVHMVTFNVQLTSDMVPVVIRDTMLDRTTTGSGAVSDVTVSRLKQFDAGRYKGAAFAGVAVPTLAEVLSIMPTNIWIVIEVRPDMLLAQQTAQVILSAQRTHQTVIACDNKTVSIVKTVSPDILICNLQSRANSMEYIRNSIETDADFVMLKNPAGEGFDALVQAAKTADMSVIYSGTNSPNDLKRFFDAGVDFIVTTNLKSCMVAAEALQISPLEPVYPEKEE